MSCSSERRRPFWKRLKKHASRKKEKVRFSRRIILKLELPGGCHSTSRRSWRQNVAQGEASAASGPLGSQAWLIFKPALAGEGICRPPRRARKSIGTRIHGFRFAPPVATLCRRLCWLVEACFHHFDSCES